MATIKNAETAEKTAKAKMEEIFVPKGYINEEPNKYISVNCVNYVLPRGKKTMVPKAVAYEFNRSQRAAQAQDEHMSVMLDAAKS